MRAPTDCSRTGVISKSPKSVDLEGDDEGSKEPDPPVYVKKRTIVEAARLASGDFLETQAEIDAYLAKLRQALESAINNDERVEIR